MLDKDDAGQVAGLDQLTDGDVEARRDERELEPERRAWEQIIRALTSLSASPSDRSDRAWLTSAT
jgi:hypothetical protein